MHCEYISDSNHFTALTKARGWRDTVPHAYIAGPNHSTLRHPDMKVSYNQVREESRLQEITLWQPVIDHELSRQYTKTWAAMENLVDSGTQAGRQSTN